MAVLKNGMIIGKAKVYVDILPICKVTPNKPMKPQFITVHNTASPDAPAKNLNSYIKMLNNTGERLASWHFTVDDTSIYQHIDTEITAWHTGTKEGNDTSIGIEICEFTDDKRQAQAEANAVALINYLMCLHKLDINKVRTHQSWSGKYCPRIILSRPNGWANFINQVKEFKKPKATVSKPVSKASYVYLVQKPKATVSKPVATASDAYVVQKPKDTVSEPVATASDVYVVQKGDTLWEIAKKFGLSVAELKALNGLKSDVIYAGDTLKVKKK